VDTAGIAEKAVDALDALSMEKSREILAEADMKILVKDGGSTGSPTLCHPERNEVESKDLNPDLVVYSKSDLLDNGHDVILEGGESRPIESQSVDSITTFQDDKNAALHVSSKTGEGLVELKRIMNASLFKKTENAEDLWITSEREKTCLEEALAGIDRTLSLIRTNPAVELIAFEMQLVRRALQSITGEISSEDVLQKIFAGFCIGK